MSVYTISNKLDQTVVSPFNDYINDIKLRLNDMVLNFQAGRLKKFVNFWRTMTRDKNILNTISGFRIEFKDFPYQKFIPSEYKHTKEEIDFLDSEMVKLLNKGIIAKSVDEQPQYISNIFLRDKKDGSYRMILNLSDLNESVEYHKFKMDTFLTAVNLVTPNCYMASIDFKDAYYSVPVHTDHRRWLKFKFRGELYEFTCLPNGLSSGPRLFTKITKPLFANLREMGHLNTQYIDDTLLLGETWEECARNVRDTLEKALDAGFVVHPIKSIFEPTQKLEFLGFWIDSRTMLITLTESKAETIKRLCSDLKGFKKPSIRTVARVVGKMVSSFPAVRFGKLFYRLIDNEKTAALKLHQGNYEAKMSLSIQAKQDLQWWIDNIIDNSAPIVESTPDITIFSDASLKGWGGARDGMTTGGNWSESESKIHINVLELMAAYYTLASLGGDLRNVHIRMMIDNTTAVAYVNGMGGRKPLCNKITRKIWDWCLERNIWLSAAYLPSEENVVADKMSRISHHNSEWSLNGEIFNRITSIFGKPEIDLFASRLNYKCDRYVAWQPDPFAEAVDAFSLNWGNMGLIYIFPPFCLMSRVLQKIDLEKADAIVIAPLWTTQPWWSKLIRLLTTCPLYLSRSRGTLTHPRRSQEELPRMELIICSLSGDSCKQARSQNKLRTSLCPLGEGQHPGSTKCTTIGGKTLRSGQGYMYIHRM